MSLRIKPAKAAGAITLLLLADVFMIITGYIGEQQFTANGAVQTGPLYFWGFISTIGYVIIRLRFTASTAVFKPTLTLKSAPPIRF